MEFTQVVYFIFNTIFRLYSVRLSKGVVSLVSRLAGYGMCNNTKIIKLGMGLVVILGLG